MAADLDLGDLREQCITSLYMCTENVSKYLDSSEKEAEFGKLKTCVQSYCLLEAQQNVAVQALERAKRETDISNLDTLEQRFAQHLGDMAGERLNVDRHPFILELNKRVEKGRQNRNNLDESDLAITEAQTQYLDPITKKAIVDPVKNSICGHIYERESIMKLIQKNSRTKCPVAGCGNRNPVQGNHLFSDEELKFRLTLTQHSTMIQERSIMDLDNTVDS